MYASLLENAADLIDQHGLATHALRGEDGQLSISAALLDASSMPGDWVVASRVIAHHRRGALRHDGSVRTANEVEGSLRETVIAPTALAATFGPQWSKIVDLFARVATADDAQILTCYQRWLLGPEQMKGPAWAEQKHRARQAIRAAIDNAARQDCYKHTRVAMKQVVLDDPESTAWKAAAVAVGCDAMAALVARDLAGTSGLDRSHCDLFLEPLASLY